MADAAPTPTADTPPPELSLGQKLTQNLAQQAEVVATETTTEQAKSLAERLKSEFGFEGVEDDAQATERLVAAYKQQQEELAKTKNEFGAQIESLINEVRASKTPEVTVESKGQQAGEWNWNPPQVDLQLAAKYKTADGWKPETPADLRQAFEARENFRATFADRFMNDPEAALGALIDKRAKEIVQQTFGQVQTEQQQQSAYSQLLQENAWVFENDPISGKPSNKLSVQGQRVNDLTAEILAQPYGAHMSQADVLRMAIERFELEKFRSSTTRQTQSQTAQELAAQKKQELVNRAAPGLATRNGSIPTATETRSQNRNLTPGQKVVQRMQRNGVALTP
jgi:hypothetical protein